jgi:hypothetical protein
LKPSQIKCRNCFLVLVFYLVRGLGLRVTCHKKEEEER